MLGGDHSITYPILKAFGGRPLHLVQFDTHMDYWNDEGGMLYTHASPIVRSHESGLVQRVTQYGIRGLHTAADQIELAGERGVTTFWCEQAKRTPVDELVAHIEPGEDVYITFDIDALDPSIAPGTGTPEPGGFSYYEAKAILRAVALQGPRDRHGHGRGQPALRPHGDHRAARRAPHLRHRRRRPAEVAGRPAAGAAGPAPRRQLQRPSAATSATMYVGRRAAASADDVRRPPPRWPA